MKLVLKKMRNNRAKGPYVYLHKGGAVRLNLGEECEVEDEVAYAILKRDGDIIEKVQSKPKPQKKKKAPSKNKMLSNYENK